MTVVNKLSDVDPTAITLCKQGANRQRIFLRKSAADPGAQVLEFQPAAPLRKSADDWSAIYCVVAVPDAEEDPGLTGDADSVDVWASEDEIRKAAHRLMKNGGYVNAAHDDGAAEGASIVESAVALTDMALVNPEGDPCQIRKGSWYVAIEPNDALRKSIEDGTVEAVSLEGTGVRTPVQKAKAPAASHRTCASCGAHMAKDASKCPNCGKAWVAKGHADVGPEARKKLKGLLDFYRKKPHPFAACVKDNTKRFGKDGAERVCATLKDIEQHDDTHWRKGGGKIAKSDVIDAQADALIAAGVSSDEAVDLLAAYMEEQRSVHDDSTAGVMRKMWRAVFPDQPEPQPIAKATVPDFRDRLAVQNLDERSWAAFTTLRQVMYDAVAGDDTDNASAIMRSSIDQFRDYLVGVLDDNPVALAKELGSLTIDQAAPAASQEDDVDDTRVKQLIEEATQPIAKSVEDLVAALPQVIAKAVTEAKPAATEEKPLTAADLKKAVDEFADKMDGMDTALVTLAKSVDQLADGGSSQDDREAVRKANGRQSLSLLD